MIRSLKSEILDSIEILIQATIKNLPFDQTVDGRIVSINNNGTYDVRIKNKVRTLKYNGSNTLKVNQVVHIKYPQNDENRAFIT